MPVTVLETKHWKVLEYNGGYQDISIVSDGRIVCEFKYGSRSNPHWQRSYQHSFREAALPPGLEELFATIKGMEMGVDEALGAITAFVSALPDKPWKLKYETS